LGDFAQVEVLQMDCCGMPLAVRAGGGFVCRRCQAEYDVPVGTALNRAARCVEGVGAVLNPLPQPALTQAALDAAIAIMEEADPSQTAPKMIPVEQPKVSGFGRSGRKGGPK